MSAAGRHTRRSLRTRRGQLLQARADSLQRQLRARERVLASAKPVAKTALVPGAVVWAHVPFEGGKSGKLRPAVVAWRCGRSLAILPVTTKRTRQPNLALPLTRWEQAGLERRSWVRRTQVVVEVSDVLATVGALDSFDRRVVFGEPSVSPPA